MANGVIRSINRERGFGFIVQDGNDPNDRQAQLFFRLEWLRGGPAREGARVEFEIEHVDQRLRARNLHLAAGEAQGQPAQQGQPVQQGQPAQQKQPAQQRQPQRQGQGGSRFLNPYNFVRPFATRRRNGDVLGNCPPPPHDRYVGLGGRITCRVEAVTPIFVSDSHAIVRPDDHATYRFFQLDGQPALPATSLRGMIRSIYETATNSCFSSVGGAPLSQHLPSRQAPAMVPARVEQTEGGWRLRLLPGTSPLQTSETMPKRPVAPQYAGWLGSYWPIEPSKTLNGVDPRLRPGMTLSQTQRDLRAAFIRRTKEAIAQKEQRNPDGVGHGEAAYALLRRRSHPSPNVGAFWDVVSLRRKREDLPARPGGDERICTGWLCITNQNIENKHSERFFFRESANDAGAELIKLPDSVRQAYETLIADYQERHAKAVAKRKHPAEREGDEAGFSRFVYRRDERRLQDGALVYAMLHGDPDRPALAFIAPVSVPRILYGKSPLDLLPEHLHRCREYAKLCPACRLFGWVHDDAEKLAPSVRTAYASRLRFSHGVLAGEARRLEPLKLAILSSPKPTTTAFYLLDSEGKPGDVDYDTPGARLRGRKVYRHHSPNTDWTRRNKDLTSETENDQNRTVRDALAPGAAFTFEIDFENLAPVELGALIWSLELEPGMHHRLGFAKPLGFGSVRVAVQKLELLQPSARYASLDPDAGRRTEERPDGGPWPAVEGFKQAYKAAMGQSYANDATAFTRLRPIYDLRILLSEPAARIHYPRATKEPTAEGENFKWFVGNKRNLEKGEGGQRLALPEEERKDASGEVKGLLRLVDARGRDV